jgi:exonuclease III
MKIATFNVNNINRRLPNFLQWLKSARPDIACLQELKSTDANFPVHAIEKAGCRAVRKHGTASQFCPRDGEPIVTRKALPGDSKVVRHPARNFGCGGARRTCRARYLIVFWISKRASPRV